MPSNRQIPSRPEIAANLGRRISTIPGAADVCRQRRGESALIALGNGVGATELRAQLAAHRLQRRRGRRRLRSGTRALREGTQRLQAMSRPSGCSTSQAATLLATLVATWRAMTSMIATAAGGNASGSVFTLLLQHRPALVAHEEIVHVVGVLLLLREDTLQQPPSRRIPVAEVAHHLAVGFDGDTLGDEVFLDHVDQVLALGILRGGSGADAIGVQMRCDDVGSPVIWSHHASRAG